MSQCKQCGGPNPAPKGFKQRETCSDRCRGAYSRRKKAAGGHARKAKTSSAPATIDAARITPGDAGLVDRVRALVAPQLNGEVDEVAAAQAALAVSLADMAAGGSVSACRELRLLLLELRVASDPTWEGEITQALMLEALLTHIAGAGGVDGIEPAGQPLPPGWRSTAQDGQVLGYIGREWLRLRDLDEVQALTDLERWVGNHSPEIFCLRATGRWSVWPDNRDSL